MTDDYLIHDGGRVSRHRTSPPAFPDQWRPVRIFTDAGLAAHDAEVAAQARADERERIAAAIEADCEADEPPCYGCWERRPDRPHA